MSGVIKIVLVTGDVLVEQGILRVASLENTLGTGDS